MRIDFLYSKDIVESIGPANPFEIWEFSGRLTSHRVKSIFQSLRYEYNNGDAIALVYDDNGNYLCSFGITFWSNSQSYTFINGNYKNTVYQQKGLLKELSFFEKCGYRI